MNIEPYFVTAINTDSGKTLVSAILCEALEADYWKPIQSGSPRDTATVEALVTSPKIVLHPEQYVFQTPVSPHAAARLDNTTIALSMIRKPLTENRLVIEGAGGCMVPLNDNDLMIDLMSALKARVIVVSNHYLGSINHTLLTIEALRHRGIPLEGIVFNGDTVHETERIILLRTGLPCLLRIQREAVINRDVVRQYAKLLKRNWNG